jgi:geranylgeranyl diphosphate/geranylgeranyl-bacteriochlorophyllide a reductase
VYDVCIIGAGPAGATLARLLPPDLRVLVVDRRHLDRPHRPGEPVKLCGGLLAPAAQRELARQGLGVPASVIAGPQLFAVRAVDHVSGDVRHYQRFYTNVDRESFDRWLLSLVPDRVDTLFGFGAYKLEVSEGSAQVWLRSAKGASASVCARTVVGADGAASVVARALGQRSGVSHYVAVQGHWDGDGGDPHYGAYFDEDLTDFYGWTIPKGDSVSVGLALRTGPGARCTFERFVTRLRDAGSSLGAVTGVRAAPLRRPASAGDVRLGNGTLLCVGEAAGLISASSAEGISYALRSGAACAAALQAGPNGAAARYACAAAPIVMDVLGKVAKARIIYTRAVRRAVMRSGVTAIRCADPDGLSRALLGGRLVG